MKILILSLLIFLSACSNSTSNTSSETIASQILNLPLRAFASTCGGVSRVDEGKWVVDIDKDYGRYFESLKISDTCTLNSQGIYTLDTSDVLSLTQTIAEYNPKDCGGATPNNYTRTGQLTRLSVDQVQWSYSDYANQACSTIIRLVR